MARTSAPQVPGTPRWPPVRAWAGIAGAVVGAVLLWLGWYEVAGETLVARQLPYIASASIPGAALLVVAAVLLSGGSTRHESAQTDTMVGALFRLLTEEIPAGDRVGRSSDAAGEGPVALGDGTRYHRRDCPLVQGKPEVRSVDREEVHRRGLQPCPVCGPVLPDA